MKQPLAEAQAIARDTKATLAARRLELDVAAQLRSLNAARAELTKTLRPIGGKAPSDDHFAEANTAVGILEKTIATVNAKEPSLVQPVAEAKALVRDSKATLNARRIELDVGEQRTRVEDARKLAGDLLKEISTLPIAKDRLEATDAAIKQIKAVLDEGAELTGKDKAYAAYDREVKTRATELEGKLGARRVAQAAFDGKAQLTETHAAAKAKVDAARLPEASDADLAAATKSVELVGKTIEAQAGLEKQDKGYADRAAKARADLQRLNESLDFGKQARELRRQTVEALAAGAAGADGAPGKPLRGQKDQYEKAIAQFRSCVGTGGSMLAENRALEGVALFVDGKKTPAKDVIALCTTRLENTEKLLVLVKPLIAFDEGLKQNYEKGRALLAQSKPADALKHFNECISSGGILQNRSPELKERKFEVAGAEMTLPEVIQQCIANRKALMAKK